MSIKTQIKTKYFHGVGKYIADNFPTSVTPKYVRDVLNGKHKERETDTVKMILKMAEPFKNTSV